MEVSIHPRISDIPEAQWNAVWPGSYPFVQHGFFLALENSGSVNGDSGWLSQHICIWEKDVLVAALPLFIKTHSYGEYVFDWSWANAYHQTGIEYYPKLLNAIPFTPSTGPRIGIANTLSDDEKKVVLSHLFAAIQKLVADHQCSGCHSLFPSKEENNIWQGQGFQQRLGYQFHWFNKNFRDFDHFLESFSSRKRKNLKKERQKVHNQNIDIKMRNASEIPLDDWHTFAKLYHRTYLKRSGHTGYLGQDFFIQLARAFPEQVLLASAHENDQLFAAALYLRDENTLYGRYWGTSKEIDGLHFECCYYQGIEYAIQHQLERFDPGAQGEHKIQRGFTPILTQSYHYIEHPNFADAIDHFLIQEKKHIHLYINESRTLTPFKEGSKMVEDDALINFQLTDASLKTN